MKSLITSNAGTLGPFTTIEIHQGGWLCDGVDYQMTVFGPSTVGEYVPPPPPAPTPPPPAPVPAEVTMRQAQLALLSAGMLDSVDAAIDAIPDEMERRKAQIEWKVSSAVRRHQPLVLSLGPALGLTDAQIDDLFRLAATL